MKTSLNIWMRPSLEKVCAEANVPHSTNLLRLQKISIALLSSLYANKPKKTGLPAYSVVMIKIARKGLLLDSFKFTSLSAHWPLRWIFPITCSMVK